MRALRSNSVMDFPLTLGYGVGLEGLEEKRLLSYT